MNNRSIEIEATLRIALEALEFFKELSLSIKEIERAEEAITAIKAALEAHKALISPNGEAQPSGSVEQEPVAWMHPSGGVVQRLITGFDRELYTIPLYTAPPQRKPLTDEKINARAKAEGANNADFWAGVRFAEAEHCIKE